MLPRSERNEATASGGLDRDQKDTGSVLRRVIRFLEHIKNGSLFSVMKIKETKKLYLSVRLL